jgi:hypothetical protein
MPTASEEVLLKEAEKLDRIDKDLRRQAVACRRIKKNGSEEGLTRPLTELDGLIAGVESMVRALKKKYPEQSRDADGPASGAYGVNEYRNALRETARTVADAKKISADCKLDDADIETPLRRGGVRASASPRAAGDEAHAGSDDQMQQVQQMSARRSKLGDTQYVELSEEEIRGLTDVQMRELAAEARAVRGATEHMNRLTLEQEEQLRIAEGHVDQAEIKTEAGRKELSLAAKYKLSAMTLTAAIAGGLIAGPIGALAGAKSAAGIIACAAAGSATSALATNQMAAIVKDKLAAEQRSIMANAQQNQRALPASARVSTDDRTESDSDLER